MRYQNMQSDSIRCQCANQSVQETGLGRAVQNSLLGIFEFTNEPYRSLNRAILKGMYET